jgi:hypothetical protein
MRCVVPFIRRPRVAALLLVLALGAGTAHAALVVNVPEVTVFTDNVNPIVGEFEVFLTLTELEATTPPMILSFNVSIVATDDTGLTFSLPQPAMTTPLFASSNGTFFSDVTSNQPHAAQDADTSVAAFQNAGLAKFPFTIAAGTPAGTQYTLELVGVNEFGDAMGNAYTNVDFTDVGVITVASIPEVNSFAATLMIALLLGIAAWVHQRSKNRAPA